MFKMQRLPATRSAGAEGRSSDGAFSLGAGDLPCALILVMTAAQAREVYAADTFEPNDTIETAAPIDVGVPLMSYVSTSGDVDYYEFTVPAWQHLRFDPTVPDRRRLSDVQVCQAIGTSATPTAATGLDERAELTLEAGTYYIRVRRRVPRTLWMTTIPSNPYTLAYQRAGG